MSREEYLRRRDQLLMQDEEIAELKAENAKLREALRNLATDPCLRTQQEACRLLQEKGDEG